MIRQASAKWTGSLQHGKGWLTTDSGALEEVPYSFGTRFENTPGTNPEELVGAAHAGCFSMALAGDLVKDGWEVESIETRADITLDKLDGNWTVKASHLTVEARVPGIEPEKFNELAESAKKNCPISRLLNAEISLEARLLETGPQARAPRDQSSRPATPH